MKKNIFDWNGLVKGTLTFGPKILINKRTHHNATCACGNVRPMTPSDIERSQGLGCKKCAHVSHGMHQSKLIRVWDAMKSRCSNKKNKHYASYGGRGIYVSEGWLSSKPFIDWALSNGYKEGLTIERIDNDGPYSPDNCRWATRADQVINRRNNRLFEINGASKVLTHWCREYGVKADMVSLRLSKGFSILDALTIPKESMRSNQYGRAKNLRNNPLNHKPVTPV